MKKSTLLKMALTLVGAFMFTGARAQNPPSPYARYDSNVTAPDTIDYVTFKTGGTTMGTMHCQTPSTILAMLQVELLLLVFLGFGQTLPILERLLPLVVLVITMFK